jgi:hypothetical protein
MKPKILKMIATWWKVGAAILAALLVLARASGDVVAMLKTPEQVRALEIKVSETNEMIESLVRAEEIGSLLIEQRLDRFGYILCDVMDRPAADCSVMDD